MVRDDLRSYLGQAVRVTIDRPLGSQHPVHGDIRYPINYGYVAGTHAGDGAPIDAYVLGSKEPLADFSGIIVALVLRADDVEDKLVVAPAGHHVSAAEILEAIDFQERYFESRVVLAADMPIPDRASPQTSPAQ